MKLKYLLSIIFAFSIFFLLGNTKPSYAQYCAGGGYMESFRQYCAKNALGQWYVAGSDTQQYVSCSEQIGLGCVHPDSQGTSCFTNVDNSMCFCGDVNGAGGYYYDSTGCYYTSYYSTPNYSTPVGGYASPYGSPSGGYGSPYGSPYSTPYTTPYTYPYVYPVPADFTPTDFYLENANGNKSYNFAPNENIYWYAQIKNQGQLTPKSQYGSHVYSNLYANWANPFVLAACCLTSHYIKDARGNYTPGTTLTYDSHPGGVNAADFIGGNYFFVGPTDGTPRTARIYVDPLNQYPDEPINYGNNQAIFRYTIGVPADLVPENFQLLNGNGVVTRGFDVGQNIYPSVTIKNNGGTTAFSKDPNNPKTITWFYKNRATTVLTGTVGDTNVEIQNAEYAPNDTENFYCIPSPGSKCGDFVLDKSWSQPTKGKYWAHVFVNYDHNAVESSYTNNQAILSYYVGYKISGTAWVDLDNDGKFDNGEKAYGGLGVTVNGPNTNETDTTAANGTYSTVHALTPGDYTVNATAPNGYIILDTFPQTVYAGTTDVYVNFRLFPAANLKSISGVIFLDQNYNHKYDPPAEGLYTGSANITATSSTGVKYPAVITNGNYKISGLLPGTYTVTLDKIPGYSTWPTTLASFNVTVGPGGCPPVGGPLDGKCDGNGNFTGMNFALFQGNPWIQTTGLDIRKDDGFTNKIPPATTCGTYASLPASSSAPGVITTGTNTSDFVPGQASVKNWIVGGGTFKDDIGALPLKTNYATIVSTIRNNNTSTNPLAPVCPGGTCNISGGNVNGVYTYSGPLTIQSIDLPPNKTLVILVDGQVTITGTIQYGSGSYVMIVTDAGFNVAANVGTNAYSCNPYPAPQLQGVFVADKSFTIDGSGSTCSGTPDNMLVISGTIVVNTDRSGGSFQNNRNLCDNNLLYPSVVVTENLNNVINAPTYIKSSSTFWQEVAP